MDHQTLYGYAYHHISMFAFLIDWTYDGRFGLRQKKKASLNDAFHMVEELTEEETVGWWATIISIKDASTSVILSISPGVIIHQYGSRF